MQLQILHIVYSFADPLNNLKKQRKLSQQSTTNAHKFPAYAASLIIQAIRVSLWPIGNSLYDTERYGKRFDIYH